MTISERINLCNNGSMPALRKSPKLVLSPMAAKAEIIKNLLISFRVLETLNGINPKLFIIAKATKPNMNQGITDLSLAPYKSDPPYL